MHRITLALVIATTLINSTPTHSQEVIPDFYKEPGITPNRSFVNQNENEYIDPFTGALKLSYTDVHIPGNGGLDINIIRSYNSSFINPANPYGAAATSGWGWNIHFGRIISSSANPCINRINDSVIDNPVLELPDGTRQMLFYPGGTSPRLISQDRWKVECPSATAPVVYSPTGVQYEMSQPVSSGTQSQPIYEFHTKKITDTNGNWIRLEYPRSIGPAFTRISSSDGRSVSITWLGIDSAAPRISSIAIGSRTYRYSYTAAPQLAGIYQLSEVERPDGRSWTYNYFDLVGGQATSFLLRSSTNPFGGTTNYNYDYVYFGADSQLSGQTAVVVRKELSTGGVWTYQYNPGGTSQYDSTTVSAPNGNTTYKHLNPKYLPAGSMWKSGLLVEKSMGSEQTERYTWAGQKISSETFTRPGFLANKADFFETNAPVLSEKTIIRDGAEHKTTYSNFDTYGNPRSVVEQGPNSGNRTTTIIYYIDSSRWIIKKVKNETESAASGRSVERTFDTKGNLLGVVVNGVNTSYTYDDEGNIASITYPRSLVHRFSNYHRGVAKNENLPEGVLISRQVDDHGNVTSTTSGAGNTTSYSYDSINRLTGISYPRGNTLSISYTANSREVTRGPLSERTTYNGFGRATSVVRGGISHNYSYDAMGNITFASHPGNSSEGNRFTYDQLKRIVRILNADQTAINYSYNSGSTTIRDERSNATTYKFRSYGNPDYQTLIEVRPPDTAATMRISRDAQDRITAIEQNQLLRTYQYNSNGYLTSQNLPEVGTITMSRDDAGNMLSKSYGSTRNTYAYDGLNRLKSATYSSGTVYYDYDDDNRMKTVDSPDGERRYQYDGNGNVVREEIAVQSAFTWSADYTYNGNDVLTSIRYPKPPGGKSSSLISYTVDSLGRPTGINSYASQISHWPNGQLKSITFPNGMTTSYGQNSRLLPNSLAVSDARGKLVDSTYSFDAAANLTQIRDIKDPRYERTFGYDSLNRITSMTLPYGSGNIAYTPTGDITSQQIAGNSLTYRYDSSNRLTRLDSTSPQHAASFTYDEMGNIKSGWGKYDYDSTPNLRCVNCDTPPSSVKFFYDGQQKRLKVERGGSVVYEFHSVHGNLLASYLMRGYAPAGSSPNILTEYVYLHGKRIAQRESLQ